VGDLRLVPKARLVEGESFGLALAVPVVLPTAGGRDFLGGEGVGVQPRLVAEYGRSFRLAANLGVDLRRAQQLRNLNTGDALTFGLGAELPFTVSDVSLAAEATLVGAVGFRQQDVEERPLELLAALKYRAASGWAAHLGAGPGLTRGYGTPVFRMLAGFGYSPAPSARPAPQPVCALGPEDVDGFQDGDACADPDNDGDGLLDGSDKCPDAPETRNGHEDEDGCPDEVPAPVREAVAPPPVDSDGDGLMDPDDRCPAVAEDKDGFEDADGCADPDNDKDGLTDATDQCPREPETINGVKDEDGCPDKGKVKVLVEGDRIVILEKVYFATNKDIILPRSFSLLQQVSAVLRANPHIEKVRVEGHTDSQGADAANQDLSQRRANKVLARLVQDGIEPGRLEAVGYGETLPVDTNKTAAGRENNRRVTFTILQTRPIEVEREAP
jgi:outer membrane protein OmpA-like peptidoglycan-associated protein